MATRKIIMSLKATDVLVIAMGTRVFSKTTLARTTDITTSQTN